MFDIASVGNHVEFHNKLIALPIITNWFHYIKSSYILVSNVSSATMISNDIRKILPNNRFLVVELNLKNRNGILPEKAWDWLRKQASLSE
jgi:hypothetical protein